MGQPASQPAPPARSADSPRLVERPNYGFERFLEKGLAMSGNRATKKGRHGFRFTDGPFKGLTSGQAQERARSLYANLDPAVRAKYEREADMMDVRSQAEVLATQEHQRARQENLEFIGMAG